MNKNAAKNIRKKRVSAKVKSVTNRARLHVYRSNKHIYAQVIAPESGKIIASSSDSQVKDAKAKTKSDKAKLVGEHIAKKAIKAKIKEVAFDRGSYKYHGRVKELAQAAREAGLKF